MSERGDLGASGSNGKRSSFVIGAIGITNADATLAWARGGTRGTPGGGYCALFDNDAAVVLMCARAEQ